MGAGVGASPGTLRKKATGLADKGAGGGGGGGEASRPLG